MPKIKKEYDGLEEGERLMEASCSIERYRRWNATQ